MQFQTGDDYKPDVAVHMIINLLHDVYDMNNYMARAFDINPFLHAAVKELAIAHDAIHKAQGHILAFNSTSDEYND